ncbi:MAG: tyrosine-type recombinase/integrase [Ktedonobacteraceae bacterium]|jgi:site-specific recombinase XerD
MELTTSQAVDLFLASLRTRSAPANTIKAYRLDLRQFLKQGPTALSEVTVDVIRAFLDSHEQHKPATRRRHAATLRAFYAWLMQQGLVQSNPMERLESIGQIERLPRPLDPDDVTKILKAIPASNLRDRAIFTLLYETGMRVGEALAIHCADLDLTQDDEKIRVFGKGQRERTVLLAAAPESIRLLRRHLKHSHITAGSIFRGDPRYGGSPLPLDYSVLRKAWQNYCKQAGVQATIHQLRHSRATQLIQAGVPITTIRKQLGHRNLQSTLLYAEVDQATVKRDLLEYQRRKGKGL